MRDPGETPPEGALVTTREVLAEESAMIETPRAGQGKSVR
jgi:hypothetical protein